ncbi:MAG: hypothetical protein Q4A15_13350, partial [Prevotellaceae bacterium]|nr:hypothetical protein [Prevotellaceae bacterium]
MDKRFYQVLAVALYTVICIMLWIAALVSLFTSCSSSRNLSEVKKVDNVKIEVLDKCESVSSQYDILKLLAFDSLGFKNLQVKTFGIGDSIHSETAQSSMTLYGLRMTE